MLLLRQSSNASPWAPITDTCRLLAPQERVRVGTPVVQTARVIRPVSSECTSTRPEPGIAWNRLYVICVPTNRKRTVLMILDSHGKGLIKEGEESESGLTLLCRAKTGLSVKAYLKLALTFS